MTDKPMTIYEYQKLAMSLRHNSMVEAWIKEYQGTDQFCKHKDCRDCGFPHAPNLLCNLAQFGRVMFGGDSYSISMSNVVWWVDFMTNHAPVGAFHWKQQRFFRRVDKGVEITFFHLYNNCPQKNTWIVPDAEWDSIVQAVKKGK
jgi:hypothetical protein